jgi:hypothetical protein
MIGTRGFNLKLRRHLSYANVMASLALFVALGGTSYAVVRIDSREIVDDSVRSKDIRNQTLRGKDVRRNSIGGGAVKELALAQVPRAATADSVEGRTAEELRVKCPAATSAVAGVCIEPEVRSAEGFLTATNICDREDRALATMPDLDAYVRSGGNVSNDGEWTSSVYLEPPPEASTFERLHALVLRGTGVVDHARVNAPNPHPFRCVALPSN